MGFISGNKVNGVWEWIKAFFKGAFWGALAGVILVLVLAFALDASGGILWGVFIVSVVVGFLLGPRFNLIRCDNCKSTNLTNEGVLDAWSEAISIKKSEKVTDVYGKEHTNNYYVPGTRCYRKYQLKCEDCGSVFEYTCSEEYEN